MLKNAVKTLLRKRGLERMQKQLTTEHRELLTNEEFNDYDTLLKFQYWVTEDIDCPWDIFRDTYIHQCDVCGYWDTHQCICYAR